MAVATRARSQRVAAAAASKKVADPEPTPPSERAIAPKPSKSAKATAVSSSKQSATTKSRATGGAAAAAAAAKPAPTRKTVIVVPVSRKRKADVQPAHGPDSDDELSENFDSSDDNDDDEEEEEKKKKQKRQPSKSKPKATGPVKRTKIEPRAVKAAPEPKPAKELPVINSRPTSRLQMLVCGEGSSGELGLGPGSSSIDVARARLNSRLDGETVGIVQFACGGMHTIALTHDGKVLTWGVNDDGALGRNTSWDGGLVEMDVDGESNDGDLNPLESKPIAIPADKFPSGTNIVQVAACDSASFVLTDTGLVYGWGIFRDSGGNWGFTLNKAGDLVKHQFEPLLIPSLQKVVKIVGSQNFVLALDSKGNVFGWGNGQQNELGHRVVERRRNRTLLPTPIGLPRNKVVDIATGAFHAFAIDKSGDVWAWGANNFGQTGISTEAGKSNASIVPPKRVAALADRKSHDLVISGGNHHSILLDKTTGEVLTWGRVDGCQTGLSRDDLEQIEKEDASAVMRSQPEPDENGKMPENTEPGPIRILLKPTVVKDLEPAVFATAAQEHNLVVCTDNKLYTWGFNANYQCGVGNTDDVETPKWAGAKDLKGQKVVSAHGGGQFTVVAAQWPRLPVEGAAPPVNESAAKPAASQENGTS